MATHSNILVWKIPWTEEPWRATVHGVAELDMAEVTEHARDHLIDSMPLEKTGIY